MTQPLCIDLFCGLGGWTEGFLSEGYRIVGFDIEEHVYGEHRYPAQLVLQDVRTIHGSQFKDAAIIVASSPCQKYSYMAMPWTKAKDLAKWYRDPLHPERLVELNELFDQPKRIQREASKAAGRYIPMIQENVKGTQPWVGRAQWHYGSYYLWGDVPALMPMTSRGRKVVNPYAGHGSFQTDGGDDWRSPENTGTKVTTMGAGWHHPSGPRHVPGLGFNTHADRATDGALKSARFTNPDERPTGAKVGGDWFGVGNDRSPVRQHSSKSSARKAASAKIAKIPFPLAQWIARVYKPRTEAVT